MNMNRALKQTSIAALLLIVILLVNLNYIQGSQADKLQHNALNTRQYQDIFEHPRGEIIAGGQVLAYSKEAPNQTGKTKKYQRFYEDGKVFSPVTGYFSSTGLTSGLENAYNSMLNGTNKAISTQDWFDEFVGKAQKGANVYTTIDPKAQQVAYNKLAQETDRRGAVVAIDIKTGAIKVAASFPSFDPNTIAATRTAAQATTVFNALAKQSFMAGNINRAYGELFPPGSSFKTVVASAAMQNGANENTSFPTPWTAPIPGSTSSVSNDAGSNCNAPQGQPMIISFAQSCNTTFALLGSTDAELGPTKVEAQAQQFGFTKNIEIEPGLTSAASVYPYNEGAGSVFLGSFGQGDTRATPLQMAMVAEAVANGGTMMKPYMVQNVKNDSGSALYTANPTAMGDPISSQTAGQMQDMMKAVVANGTASNLRGTGLAGKTGTAELSGDHRGLWFVGYAPDNDPKIAFAVMIEGTRGDFGASKSGPVAEAVANQILKDMQ